jgi:hypothetical protein
MRGKWDYYGNDTWTWTPSRHYRVCLQISKDDGPREKIRWENEDGKWVNAVQIEIKDKEVPKPKIDPKTNKTIFFRFWALTRPYLDTCKTKSGEKLRGFIARSFSIDLKHRIIYK